MPYHAASRGPLVYEKNGQGSISLHLGWGEQEPMIKVNGESGTGVNKKVGTAAPSSESKEKGGKESRGRCPSSLSPSIDLVDRGNRREEKAPRHAST